MPPSAVNMSELQSPSSPIDLNEMDSEVSIIYSGPRVTTRAPAPAPASASTPAPGPVIGIDLGTTYSVVAIYNKGKVEIFSNEGGSRTTPSVAGFLNGDNFVGEAAKDLPANCQVFDAKRLIGRSHEEVLALNKGMMYWPFMVVEKKGVPAIRVVVKENQKEDFFPEEISAMVLRNLKEVAEASLQQSVSRAVVTVPAFFNERQRQMTKLAGKIAGLDVVAMINEPTAAAIAYGLNKRKGPNDVKKNIFIYDLGGGTFDVSVMTVHGSDFTVLGSGGDTHLGGQDFDIRLMNTLKEDVRSQHNVRLHDSLSLQELRRACELAKRKLSSLSEVPVNIFFPRHNFNYKTSVTRARFEDLCADLFKKTLEITAGVLTDAKLTRDAVDEVVLVGGSTRIPKVRQLLRDYFDKEPRTSINPDEAVAYGAAVHAAVLADGPGGALSNLVRLRDVTPLSLGIRSLGGVFSAVIPRNTPIPCKRMKTFTKPYKSSTSVGFRVFQGERLLAKDNHYLNKKFSMPVPRDVPIEDVFLDCSFEVNADGLLTVTARDRSTGISRQVTVSQEEGALSEEAVRDMVERAERLRHQDGQELELLKAKEALPDADVPQAPRRKAIRRAKRKPKSRLFQVVG